MRNVWIHQRRRKQLSGRQRAVKLAIEQGIAKDKVATWITRMDHRTGIVAILDTKREGKTKAFRFDMDALTVAEVWMSTECR